MEIDRNVFVDSAITDSYDLDDYDTYRVRKQVSDEFESVLELNDPEIIEKRLQHFGVGKPSDYMNRLISTDEGNVIAGIRHLGSDKNKPFILVWPSFNVKLIGNVTGQIAKHFEAFSPERIHYWSRPGDNETSAGILQQRFIGKLSEMPKSNLTLSPPSSSYYQWYKSEYQLFHDEYPGYIHRIQANSKDTMDASHEQGLLFLLTHDEDIVGLVSGEKDRFLNRPSVYLNEILVAHKFRRKGYANKLLGSFTKELKAEYLVCDIDADNLPSVNCALRSGQRVFSEEHTVEI